MSTLAAELDQKTQLEALLRAKLAVLKAFSEDEKGYHFLNRDYHMQVAVNALDNLIAAVSA